MNVRSADNTPNERSDSYQQQMQCVGATPEVIQQAKSLAQLFRLKEKNRQLEHQKNILQEEKAALQKEKEQAIAKLDHLQKQPRTAMSKLLSRFSKQPPTADAQLGLRKETLGKAGLGSLAESDRASVGQSGGRSVKPIRKKRIAAELRREAIRAFKSEHFHLALGLLLQSFRFDKNAGEGYLWLSRTHAKLRKDVDAYEAASEAVRAEPDNVRFHHEKITRLRSLNDHAGVEDAIAQMLRDSSPDQSSLSWALNLLSGCHTHQLIMRLSEKILEFAPEDEKALTAKYIAAVKLATDETRERQLGEIPDSVAGRNAKLKLFVEGDDPVGAYHVLQSVTDNDVDCKLLKSVVRGLRQQGHLTQAGVIQKRLAGLQPENPVAQQVLENHNGQMRVMRGEWSPSGLPTHCVNSIPGRVLHLVGKSLPHSLSGYTIRTQSIVESQRAAGLDPRVVTPLEYLSDGEQTDQGEYESVEEIPHFRLRSTDQLPQALDQRLTANVKALTELVRREQPAILHAHSDFLNGLVANHVGRLMNLPVIYEARGFWEETWLSKMAHPRSAIQADAYQMRRARETQCMREATHVVTLAEVMKQDLIERGIPEEQISLVRNAVDVERFQPAPADSRLKKSLGLRDDDVVIGYISSFVGYEGIRFLIDAIAQLRQKNARVRGLLVGDGESEVLKKQVRDLGLQEQILFTGQVPHDEIPLYYNLIDIFVVPRTADRVCHLVTPLKPYEAMAMQKAVVVSRLPALSEMVEEEVSGLTFEPENTDDLVRVLEPLIRDPERRHHLGRTAREWVARERNWTRNGKIYLDLYQQVTEAAAVRT